jgi:hypothetical protein
VDVRGREVEREEKDDELWRFAYDKKRNVVSCMNGDSLRADACDRGLACHANPHTDSDALVCGVRYG